MNQAMSVKYVGVANTACAPCKHVMDEWMAHPGASVALDIVLRLAGAAEPAWRDAALDLIMSEGRLITHAVSGVCQTLSTPNSSGSIHFLSLYLCLLKATKQGILQGARAMPPWRTYEQHPTPRIMARHLLNQLYNFTRKSRPTWNAQGFSAVTAEWSANSSTAGSASRPLNTWLRMQLVLVRSYVLLHLAVHKGFSNRTRSLCPTVDDMTLFAEEFKQQCSVGHDCVLLRCVLNACGLGADLVLRSPGNVAWRHARWERFAFVHLKGRVLPGCSNWGCLKLPGLIEAVLPTRLCRGCRRARYCCVGCQKAAWVDGGHQKVCGEFGPKRVVGCNNI